MTSFAALGQFRPTDDLWSRLQRNFDRLEEEKYQPEHVFQRDTDNWPGDTEGRTVLALVLLAQATGRTPQHLERILERWPRELNERGYFGTIHPEGLISEQQLSAHGWVLRALAELERWRPGGPARTLAEPVITRLILPTVGRHRDYPIDPALRRPSGSYSGTHLGRVGNWLLSTDVGCNFIGLDGIVDAYEVFRDERLPAIIDEMIARFLQIDLVAVRAQTHATLTACRALLRWSEITNNDALAEEVAERFRCYTSHAWTVHYANYNWFGRPEWTEPCAVVDSLMLAMELWRRTGQLALLEAAHHIYFNALGHGQRVNGGFGCDNCPGADGEDDLYYKVFEAHWCCTMRGGEGLARMTQYCLAEREDDLVLPFWLPGEARLDTTRLMIASGYPFDATMTIRWQPTASNTARHVVLPIPSWVDHAHATNESRTRLVTSDGQSELRLPLDGDEVWTVTGTLEDGVRRLKLKTPAARTRTARFHGPLLLLATRTDTGESAPIFAAYASGVENTAGSRRRLLQG